MSVVVFGGHGVFGSLVGRELGSVTIASRRTGTDVNDPEACRAALRGQKVAVHCAGPFQRFDDTLLEACLEERCHYVDIADDAEYCAGVRALSERFAAAGLTAAYGCSSLPGISGALATGMRRARITLCIGNNNRKGYGAVASMAHSFVGERALVELPEPFGRRRVFAIRTADEDLLPGAQVYVGFESRLVTRLLPLCVRWPRLLTVLGRLMPRMGHSGGAVLCEDLATGRRKWISAAQRGQHLAALPAVLCTRAILERRAPAGAHTAYQLLGAEELLNALEEAGYPVYSAES